MGGLIEIRSKWRKTFNFAYASMFCEGNKEKTIQSPPNHHEMPYTRRHFGCTSISSISKEGDWSFLAFIRHGKKDLYTYLIRK